jgi:hypothetical protein
MSLEEKRKEVIASFKAPAYPYVAFLVNRNVSRDGVQSVEPQTFVLPIDGHHADPYKIDQYQAKGWSIFSHRMPTAEEKKRLGDKFRGTTNFGDNVDQWAILEEKILISTGAADQRVKQLESEKDELERRVQEMLAEKKKISGVKVG